MSTDLKHRLECLGCESTVTSLPQKGERQLEVCRYCKRIYCDRCIKKGVCQESDTKKHHAMQLRRSR